MLSEAKSTLAARVEDKFICIIPCEKEENKVKSRLKGVIMNYELNMVSVVILNYNGLKLMQKYLPTVIENSGGAEVVVADNGSTDGSVEWLRKEYPKLRLIVFKENYGFAEGYNQALKQVDNEYYVLLNSDVRTPKGWLEPLVEYMERQTECAACQPKIRSEYESEKFEYAGAAGGFMDVYGYPFCRGRMMGNVETDNGQYDSIQEIFWATGACLLIRSKAYWDAGGLDGRFFAHQEEIDLCWRLKARGASIVCVPQSTVYHVGGGSLGYESPFKTRLNFRNNALLLYKNLSADRYWWTYIFRLFLDWVAALQMLLEGKPKNAWAVVEAQIEFIKMYRDFSRDREYNLKATKQKKPEGLLNLWLIWQVYFNKKKKFSDL